MNLADWNKLPEVQLRSLFFLRGLRDAQAKHILADAGRYEGDEADDDDEVRTWVNDIVTLRYPNRGYSRLSSYFAGRQIYDPCNSYEAVDVLLLLSRKIGRLERERCNLPPLRDLMDA